MEYLQEEKIVRRPTTSTAESNQTSVRVVAPIAAPFFGSKKSLAGTLPSAPRAFFSVDGSTLVKLELDQLPDCHELPVALIPDAVKLTCELPTFATAMLLFMVELELLRLKPTSPLFHAVLRSKVKLPGFPLSIKPFFAFAKAMELRTMWLAGGLSVIPSLKPLPSPSKELKPQRLKPLPHAYTSSSVTGDPNMKRSSPSSTLSHRRALRRTLPSPEPSLHANPSADSPFLRGSRLR